MTESVASGDQNGVTLPTMDTTAPEFGLNAAVAAELRGYRAARQMTVDQLAHDAGISKRQVIRLLHAERDIDVRVIALLCAALKVDPRELMSRSVERVLAEGSDLNGTIH